MSELWALLLPRSWGLWNELAYVQVISSTENDEINTRGVFIRAWCVEFHNLLEWLLMDESQVDLFCANFPFSLPEWNTEFILLVIHQI